MSGFFDKYNPNSTHQKSFNFGLGAIQKNLRDLSMYGISHNVELLNNSKGVGVIEAENDAYDSMTNYTGTGYREQDTFENKFIAFYDIEYEQRREFLRRFALHDEIEQAVEVICDEAIVYDTSKYFCYPDTKELKNVLKDEKAEEIIDDLNECFKTVYSSFNFINTHDGWQFMKKFLIDGFLAFEIIYDTDEEGQATTVIGFKELDPISLEPEIRNINGREVRVWVQYRGDTTRQRELLDINVVYLSWANRNSINRLSYVERLVRSFNMFRTMENSRLVWNVQNAQKKVKIGVPVGNMPINKIKTALSEFTADFKEDVAVNFDSGEITYNGQPNFQFAKTYIMPVRDGSSIEIGEISSEGYDLNSTESLKYFFDKFIIATKLPKDRFASYGLADSGAVWTPGDQGISREEIKMSMFINRIRNNFSSILLEPTWYMFCIKHPEFKDDHRLKSLINLTYVEENLFRMAKKRQIAQSGATCVTTLYSIKEPYVGPDGSMSEMPAFDVKFLMEKYMDLSDDDFKINNAYKEKRMRDLEKLQKAVMKMNQQAQGAMGGGMPGGDMGGGMPGGGMPGGDMGGGMPGGDMGGGMPGGDDLGGGFGDELSNNDYGASDTE